MIFTFGAIGFIIGWLFMNLLGAKYAPNWADYTGMVFIYLGIIGMITSGLMLTWQYLP